MVEVTVGEMEAGKKMHRLLRQLLPGVPLSGIHKMLRTGRVKKNGKKASADDVATLGDVVRLYMSSEDYAAVSKPVRKFAGVDSNIDIIYEDTSVLIVNKPAGLLIHGTKEEQKNTLSNQVLAYLFGQGADIRAFAPAPVHRLDRNTSGLVVFAKSGEAARRFSRELASHDVRKWYLAIVGGSVAPHGVIDVPVERNIVSNRTRADKQGKTAVTVFHRITGRLQDSLVLIELITGRTHQIRAHFQHIGHPLYGDTKYGGGSSSKGDAHQWLHAGWLLLPDGREFFAPLPAPFRQQLLRMGYSRQELEDVGRIHPAVYFPHPIIPDA